MASTFAVENGHKIARLLKYFDGPPYNIPELLDAELLEVRGVLDGLQSLGQKGCWCRFAANEEHSITCQRARALYEKLRTDK